MPAMVALWMSLVSALRDEDSAAHYLSDFRPTVHPSSWLPQACTSQPQRCYDFFNPRSVQISPTPFELQFLLSACPSTPAMRPMVGEMLVAGHRDICIWCLDAVRMSKCAGSRSVALSCRAMLVCLATPNYTTRLVCSYATPGWSPGCAPPIFALIRRRYAISRAASIAHFAVPSVCSVPLSRMCINAGGAKRPHRQLGVDNVGWRTARKW